MTRKTRVDKTCILCGQPFEVKAYRAATAKYCSDSCRMKRNPPVTRNCEYCGQPFTVYGRLQQRFCSRSCSKKPLNGPMASRWKDGKSLERERARLGTELRSWRNEVYARDEYRCQKCGAKEHLHAHHIKPWAEYPDLRFDVSNGQTLCEACHGEVHGKNFASRRIKKCIDCGKAVQGRGLGRCHSCATTHWHRTRSVAVATPSL